MTRSSGRRIGLAVAVIVAALVLGAGAEACTVCIPVPERTAADRLIASETVVLAREDPDRPFNYAPVEVLKGEVAGPIDLFLNSSTRRKLALSPEHVVVLAHDTAEGWRTLGYADSEYETVVRQILERASAWPSAGSPGRLAYFADLLGHANRTIAELAYLEVGRAPYGTIRTLSDRIPAPVLRELIRDVTYYEWRPLAILMLAQSEAAADRRLIERSFEIAHRHGNDRHLAAWATAYLEIGGADALERIEDLYVRASDRRQTELLEIVKALSVHGTDGHIELRPHIVDAYAHLLDNHPSTLGSVVKDLAAWREWGLVGRVREIAADRMNLDQPTLFAVGYYLGLAAEFESAAIR